MADKSLNLRTIRAHDDAQLPPRFGLRILTVFVVLEALLLLALSLTYPVSARAEPVKAQVSVNTSGGFGRFVFRFSDEVEADVRLSNGILVVAFKQPIEVSVDRIPIGAPDYVNAARRDPDGTAVRLALSRKVTVNTMAAGERLFVDLLPEGWVGLPPGLPLEVVDELARRAREAEKKERQRRQLAQQRQPPPLRLRVGTQPTFTRYVIELPELIPVTTDRGKEDLTLTFDASLRFDLSDALAALPPTVAKIEARPGEDNVSLRFEFSGSNDVRTFREDHNFIVDVLTMEAGEPPSMAAASETAPSGPPPAGAPATAPTDARAPTQGPREGALVAPTATPDGETPTPAPNIAIDRTTPPSASALPARKDEAALRPPPDKPAGPSAGARVSKETVELHPEGHSVTPSLPPPAPPGAKVGAAREAQSDNPPARTREPNAPVVVEVQRQGEQLRLAFPFAAPTPAAVFRRVDTVWLVFDTAVPIDVAKLVTQSIGAVRTATVTRSREGQVVRIKVDRPKLTSVEADGPIWTVTLGDTVLEPTRPLGISRAAIGPRRSSALIPFDAPQRLHRLSDPEIGDTLLVVTALGPPRGFLRTQNFVEFRALASTHGVAIQPIADDLNVEVAADKILIGRSVGLTMSGIGVKLASTGEAPESSRRLAVNRPFTFDAQLWGFDRQADFVLRQSDLIRTAADAPEGDRSARRLELARFYLARDMHAEAKAVLDVLLSDDHPKAEEAGALVLRAVADIMMGRSADALKDLANLSVGDQFDAPLWRALAYARQGRWVEAREGFKTIETAVSTMPIELQRIVFKEAARAAIEVRDFADAANQLNELDTLGVPGEFEPTLQVLRGRIAEGLGRIPDALVAYRNAADSWDRPPAAQGRLREIVLRSELGEINRSDAINGLEALTTTWRGDETEVEALQLLGRLYTEEGRYRDAFHVMRTALTAHPGSELTRRIHDEAAATFDALFLDGKGDAMPAVEALSLFYDFRELTPVGRRGDEMIRRLADRLVSIDLLDQAAALLQHQVDHRLQGAARAQIAVRLAVIYLMSRKPDRAIAALRTTRSGDLPNELRQQRLLLEARALSDTGRHDLALEVISNMEGKEVERLRADVLWAARRWREAGEQIEKLYGERWREFAPLTEAERADMMRAGIAFSLANDALGLDRFREKYAAKMAEGSDRRAFDVVTVRSAVNSAEFGEIARKIAGIDTLESFLRDVRARFPQAGATSPPRPVTPQPAPPPGAPGSPRAS